MILDSSNHHSHGPSRSNLLILHNTSLAFHLFPHPLSLTSANNSFLTSSSPSSLPSTPPITHAASHDHHSVIPGLPLTSRHVIQPSFPFASYSITSMSHSLQQHLNNAKSLAGTPEVLPVLNRIWQQFGPNQNNVHLTDSSYYSPAQLLKDMIVNAFLFPLDDFQIHAIEALAAGRNVVVSAPTGSGKTVVAEAAVYIAMALGKKLFYTTPLKALSNQKYRDFQKLFGETKVGLLTGDNTVNRDAEIVVMTTEVYRNMLYAAETRTPIGGIRSSKDVLDRLFAVVFDEFHYMNDQDRGTVWEEAVINAPQFALQVALSATIANTAEVREWFQDVHSATELITSDFRPVPLNFVYATRTGLTDLFAVNANHLSKSPAINQRLRSQVMDLHKSKRAASSKGPNLGPQKDLKAVRLKFDDLPSFPFVVRCLRRSDMLPAIIFLFSRVGCDKAAAEVANEKESLVTPQEQALIKSRLDTFAAFHPEIVNDDRIALALQGIASHHAGILPIWKNVVENLFQENLIKVVFATETLAAGINMPARTTVISSLSKRTGEDIVKLTTAEFLQMAGRAGRRGKDVIGHVVTMHSMFEGPEDAFRLITQQIEPLRSKFTPSYGMVLNLLTRRSLDDCKLLVEKSFENFLSKKKANDPTASKKTTAGLQDEDRLKIKQYENAKKTLELVNTDQLRAYIKVLERIKAEVRTLQYLIQQDMDMKDELIAETLPFMPPGSHLLFLKKSKKSKSQANIISFGEDSDAALFMALATNFKNKHVDQAEPAILLKEIENPMTNAQTYGVLTKDNEIHFITDEHVVAVDFENQHCINNNDPDYQEALAKLLTSNCIPERDQWMRLKSNRFYVPGNEHTAFLVQSIPEKWTVSLSPDVQAQSNRITKFRVDLESSPIHQIQDKIFLIECARKVAALEGEVISLKASMATKKAAPDQGSWIRFTNLVTVLTHFGFLDENTRLTEFGQIASSIRTENEVWVTLVLISGELEKLNPAQLAAVIYAVISEGPSRAQTYFDFETSPAALEACENLNLMATKLVTCQEKNFIEISVPLEATEIGLVESWASGLTWPELIAKTSLQEGDICRRLRRVMDLLQQIQRIPFISKETKQNAKRAVTVLDRFPVSDEVTYSVNPRYREKREGGESEVESSSGDEEEYRSYSRSIPVPAQRLEMRDEEEESEDNDGDDDTSNDDEYNAFESNLAQFVNHGNYEKE